MSGPIEIYHNLDADRFVWLWMKYVTGAIDSHHCTNVLRGRYSKKLSKHNPRLMDEVPVICDEYPSGTFSALYICGVAKQGYSTRENYPHNLHVPICPSPGQESSFLFENWELKIHNGAVLAIPAEQQLPECYRLLPQEYTTCRIFRWAVGYFRPDD